MTKRFTFTALMATALAFLLGGLIIASCLDFTPHSTAQPVPTAPAAAPQPQWQATARSLPDFTTLAKQLGPGVVNISTTKVIRSPFAMRRGPQMQPGDPFEEFFNRFFQGVPRREFRQRSLGSGFIIDKEGYILTNNHVVDAADEIIVTTAEEEEYKAKIIGKDPKTDLALIKIDANGALTPLPMGDSDQLQIGEWILAIGNPFGLSHTVTAGIVSAKGRVIGAGPYDNFIQTDASINPGNSGGPLINMRGEVVGINTAIFSNTGQSAGIGFALPINLAKNIAKQLREKGKVTRGWLGVLIQRIDPDLQKSYGLKKSEGALVSNVVPNSPAAKAGIKQEDIITKFNGVPIQHHSDLPVQVASVPPGTKVKVVLLRDGKEKEVEVTIEEMKEEESAEQVDQGGESEPSRLGLQLQDLTPELSRQMGVKGGIVIAGVESGSIAEEKGLQSGDIILRIGEKPVSNVRQFVQEVRSLKSGTIIRLHIRREGNEFFVGLPKP